MQPPSPDAIRNAVRDRYVRAAAASQTPCGCGPSCCGGSAAGADAAAVGMGYGVDDLASLPRGVNLGLGCGNPLSAADLRPGETVLDLGSGAGIDCMLAARAVGPGGRVIGVDMTREMIKKAQRHAAESGITNVEFRLGEIENLPVGEACIDVVVSNCVVNLSPDKASVWREAFRVLKPGGRIAVSDIVATAALPPELRCDMELYTACTAGASTIDETVAMLRSAGFEDVRIEPKEESRAMIREWAPGRRAEEYLVSAHILARKPRR